MSFLRRILGGGASRPEAAPTQADVLAVQDEEAARERELLRDDARRLDDDLIGRQVRYADRAWTPPAQGGTRRAEDKDEDADEG